MGKKMVKYCGGLPLAVKVLGGLLANKTMVEEWKRVDDNIQTQIVRIDDKNQDSVYRVLSMSYEDLPMQLKHCFLYLAHFPEDYEIQVERLYYLWEAEGIITSSGDGETTRKIGEEYIDELVRRNMVIGVKEDLSCKWEYCQMHDMMREVCLYKAKEENFLLIIKVPTSSTSTINAQSHTGSRRLVVHGGGNAFDMLERKNNQKARSVLGLGLDSNFWKQSGQGFQNLLLLRVLDLSLDYKIDSKGWRIPSSIHLRYLRLYMGHATHVPSSLRNLKLLIYLSIYSRERVHLPSIFKEMVQLRFLVLPPFVDARTKLELGNLVNLEYLICFQSQYGSITDFLRMNKLRNLHIQLKGYTSEILASSLCELRKLEELSLIDENNESDGAYDVDFVWNFIHLRRLGLSIHGTRLPDHSRFPPHLAHITLRDCEMEDDPLQILEKLLHLKSAVSHQRSFVGRKMVCSKGGFPQLCKLQIELLDDWEEWIVEEGSMPCLRTLSIWYCEKLKELPEGLKYITSLKELQIIHKKKEWETKLVPGGESYHKVQHIPSVQLHYFGDTLILTNKENKTVSGEPTQDQYPPLSIVGSVLVEAKNPKRGDPCVFRHQSPNVCITGLELPLPISPELLHSLGAVNVGKSMVVVFGGLVDKKFLNDIIVYDIENKLWFEPECTGSVSEGKVGPTPRAFHVAITIDCHMFIFGGRSGGKRLGDFWVLDTDIWQWSELTSFGDLPTPRDFSAAAAIGNQKIVLCGGWDGKKWLSDVYVMDTMSLEWMELSVSGSLPPPRCGHTATMVEKRLLVFGGRGGGGPIMGDLWALKGLIDEERETPGWTQLKLPGQAPSSRCGHTVTSGGHYLLLFGGHGTGGWLSRYDVYYNDTIILDRVTAQWKRLPISNDEPPPPRAYHTMTSIGARHLLIGGFDGKTTFGDLWWLVPEDDPIAKRSSVPQLRNPPETKESERELDMQERGQEGSTIVDLQKKMGISVSSGPRLQIPEVSEDQEFVELGTRLIEGDVIDNRASMMQMAAQALRQHWKESTPETLQLKELGSFLRDYQRLVTRKYTAQGSLASGDFGLPGKKTFTFYHMKTSSELRMDDIPKLLEEYKTLLN
ncbi:hypothetical protein IGI04_018069 [Brassica rapa subsp. trilocularis]|uniref:NB-ARC domain-containing protein n=1 Tax=Brassica rapa subsp. trilocularis TaxID=1813537 RepID=A0ABQ7MBV0_BRACM|nr:hypothetical protein IGI04_018069 [Brassica rapa subsp. trilocularis]